MNKEYNILNLPNYNGLIFVGDPHLWSRKPGRRLDDDFNLTIMNKLNYIYEYAKSNSYLVVFLGDIFEDSEDMDALMINRIIKYLRKFDNPPISIVGNHDKKHTNLTDDTALASLRDAGLIHLAENENTIFCTQINNKKVLIGAAPYGFDIPTDVSEQKQVTNSDLVIWLSHHDLAFMGAYPGAKEIKPIISCDYLVNGHMHKSAPDVIADNTTYKNPGNIVRMSVDVRNQKPKVIYFDSNHQFNDLYLPHEPNSFDLTGLLFKEKKQSTEEAIARTVIINSDFASLLSEQKKFDAKKSDDAAYLKEELNAFFEIKKIDDNVKADILELLETTIKNNLSS